MYQNDAAHSPKFDQFLLKRLLSDRENAKAMEKREVIKGWYVWGEHKEKAANLNVKVISVRDVQEAKDVQE